MYTNGFRRCSTDILPTFRVPRKRFLIACELILCVGQRAVNISVVCSRPENDQPQQADALLWCQAGNQRENIVSAQRFGHERYSTRRSRVRTDRQILRFPLDPTARRGPARYAYLANGLPLSRRASQR